MRHTTAVDAPNRSPTAFGLTYYTVIADMLSRCRRHDGLCECDETLPAVLFLSIPSLITRLLKSGKWLCSQLTGSNIVATSWKNVVVKHAASRRRHQTLSVEVYLYGR